jgi:hypothetical protein
VARLALVLALVLAALTVLGRALYRMAPEIFDLLRRLVVLRHIERVAARHGLGVWWPARQRAADRSPG